MNKRCICGKPVWGRYDLWCFYCLLKIKQGLAPVIDDDKIAWYYEGECITKTWRLTDETSKG